MIDFFDELLQRLPEWGPHFLTAAGYTLRLTACSMMLAVLLGLIVAILTFSSLRPLRWLAAAYVDIGRGTPPLVILFMIYFGLQDLLPTLRMDSFSAATIGLGLQGGAILAEVFRSGVEAIDRGQREAALSLGLTPLRAALNVIVPQAARVIVPPFGNYAVGLIKDTSIASIIAVPEIMLRAKDLASVSFMPMHLYVLAALFYLAMSLPLSLTIRRMESSKLFGKRRK